MYIAKLALDHFRSWTHLVVDLGPGITIFQGTNGLGKTNIVEAVEVLSTGTSHRVSSSLPLIERGSTSAVIRANVDDNDQMHTYELTIRAKSANRGRIDGGPAVYMRDIIGKIPSVTFSPDDQRLITAEPALRRGFLDQACTLLIDGYAQRLQQFTKIARQRAALLRTIGTCAPDDPRRDASLGTLEIWTGQFIAAGVAISRDRATVIERLCEPFSRIYSELASNNGTATLRYEPSFDEILITDDPALPISQHFQRLFAGETARGVNLIGPQRDDVLIALDDMPAREFASNGEMWTLALALKMALYEVIRDEHGIRPIVILDDVFAQLDDQRRARILQFASQPDQVLITVAAAGDIPMMNDLALTRQTRVIDVAQLQSLQDEHNDELAQLVANVAASRTQESRES